MVVSGRAGDQSWQLASQRPAGFLTAGTAPGTESRSACALPSPMTTDKKEGTCVRAVAGVTPSRFCSPLSLVPSVCLYSADTLDLLSH